ERLFVVGVFFTAIAQGGAETHQRWVGLVARSGSEVESYPEVRVQKDRIAQVERALGQATGEKQFFQRELEAEALAREVINHDRRSSIELIDRKKVLIVACDKVVEQAAVFSAVGVADSDAVAHEPELARIGERIG